MSDSVRFYGLSPSRFPCSWDSPGMITEVGYHFLLQGIFLTQGWNPCLLTSPALAGWLFTTSASSGMHSLCNFSQVGKALIWQLLCVLRASLVAQMVRHLPAMQETWVRSLGWEDPLEKGMATHSSILAWKIPWTEESGRLQSMGSQRVGHDWVTSLHFTMF